MASASSPRRSSPRRSARSSDHARSVADLIPQDITAAKGAALITTLLILGILFAVMLADIVGRIALQVLGFIGCAAGLFLASLSGYFADGDADSCSSSPASCCSTS